MFGRNTDEAAGKGARDPPRGLESSVLSYDECGFEYAGDTPGLEHHHLQPGYGVQSKYTMEAVFDKGGDFESDTHSIRTAAMNNVAASEEEQGELKGGCFCCAICEGPTCFLGFTLKFLILGLLAGIVALALPSWFWTGVVEHKSQAVLGSQTYDYKFYSMVSYGIEEFCHYPQSIPDLDNNIDIAIPTLSDWKCEKWDSLNAKVTQGDATYTITDCSSSNCKTCRESMQEGLSWGLLGLFALIPVGVEIILSKCCHNCMPEKCEKVMVFLGVFCLAGSVACFVTGLRYASAECASFNQELAFSQEVIWNATTNGAEASASSLEIGPSAYLAIGTIACGALALFTYALYFFFMSGASWLIFLVLMNGGLSVGFAIASLSFNSWYWTGIEKHSSTAISVAGNNVDYTFYTLITYGASKFCYYPKIIPSLDNWLSLAIPSLDDLTCKGWEDLEAYINIGGTERLLLSCSSSTNTSLSNSPCNDCRMAMKDGEIMGSLAVSLTIPVVAVCAVFLLGDNICPKSCFGRRAHQFLSLIGLGTVIASVIIYVSALGNAAGMCDDLNDQLKQTTAGLWDIATNGKETDGSELGLGASAICAVIALIFAFFAFITFLYFACTTTPPRSGEDVKMVASGDKILGSERDAKLKSPMA